MGFRILEQNRDLKARESEVLHNEAAGLAAVAQITRRERLPADAAKIALAAWPQNPQDPRPALASTWNTLRNIAPELLERKTLQGHAGPLLGAIFSPDDARILTWSMDGTARLWDISTIPEGHIFSVICAWLPNAPNYNLEGLADAYDLKLSGAICEEPDGVPLPERTLLRLKK